MKFSEWLKSVNQFDGEIITKQFESNFSFVWDENVKITEEGYQKFREILDSDIKIDNNVVALLSDKIDEDLYNLFMRASAGWIGVRMYDRWFEGT